MQFSGVCWKGRYRYQAGTIEQKKPSNDDALVLEEITEARPESYTYFIYIYIYISIPLLNRH